MASLFAQIARCAFLLTLVFSSSAWAQNYPTRNITIIVPNPAGAATDLLPRLLADDMSAELGKPIVIVNRDGAAGSLGSAEVARASPDGYTLLMTVNPPITMNVYLQKNIPYDPHTAFTPIGLAATAPLILVVRSALPVKTVAELVAYAKQHPGELSYGSAGVGTGHHIVGEWIKKETGIQMTHVPYRGSGPVITDLLSGVIQVGFGTLPAIAPATGTGAVRILAIAEAKRSSVMPDVPTISETLPGITYDAWYGLLGPARLPEPIVERLNGSIDKALQNPTTIEKLRVNGLVPARASPAEFRNAINAELNRWAKIMPELGLEPQ
jgi:tripartite-type tricarboxylate transporter receptor subunit TctC